MTIAPSNTRAPWRAAAPVFPTAAKTMQAADNDSNNKDNDAAVSSEGATSIAVNKPKIVAKPPTVKTITPNVKYALGAILPIPLIDRIIMANEAINIDKDAADAKLFSTGILDNVTRIAANAATATVITIRVPIDPFISFAECSINANMPINMLIDAVAPARLRGSINDKTATEAAMIPIATDITTRLSLTFFAPRVDSIIADNTAPSIVMAIRPFARPGILILPKSNAVIPIIPMAADIANTVPPILTIFAEEVVVNIVLNNLMMPTKPRIAASPLMISPTDILLIILVTAASIIIEDEMPRSVVPSLVASLTPNFLMI